MQLLLLMTLSYCLLSINFGAFAAEALPLSRYSWAAKSGAAYYRGRFVLPEGSYGFRTRGTQITLPRSLQLTILAVDPESRPLGTLEVTEIPVADSPLMSQPPTTPGTEPKPKDEVQVYLESIDALLESQGAFRIKDEEWTPPPAKEPHSYQWTIGAQLGIGTENLKAGGSVANYSGQSYTGDTNFALRWESQGGMKNGQDDPWGVEASIDFHSHRTKVLQDNIGDSSSQATDEKIYRVRFHGSALYKIPSSPENGSGYELQGGLGGFRLPVFTVRDEASGRVQFNDAQPIGPRIGIAYVGILTPAQSWKAGSAIIPVAKDKGQTGRQFSLAANWIYLFSEELTFTSGVSFFQEQARSSLSCSRAVNCEEQSSVSAQQLIFTIGAAHQL